MRALQRAEHERLVEQTVEWFGGKAGRQGKTARLTSLGTGSDGTELVHRRLRPLPRRPTSGRTERPWRHDIGHLG